MTWRLNYLVTTLPAAVVEVHNARKDWQLEHYAIADPRKVGYAIPSPVVKDSRGVEYLCELVGTHYDASQGVLIFVWKPTLTSDELPDHLKNVPDHDPAIPSRKYGGE